MCSPALTSDSRFIAYSFPFGSKNLVLQAVRQRALVPRPLANPLKIARHTRLDSRPLRHRYRLGLRLQCGIPDGSRGLLITPSNFGRSVRSSTLVRSWTRVSFAYEHTSPRF